MTARNIAGNDNKTLLGNIETAALGLGSAVDIGLQPGMSSFAINSYIPSPDSTFRILSALGTGALQITFPETGKQLSFTSSSANDNASGTGLATFWIFGLDSNYESLFEQITLTGTTPVLSSGTDWFRVNLIFGRFPGSAGDNESANEGIIYVSEAGETYTTPGIPDNVCYNCVGVGDNWSLTSIYTTNAIHNFTCSRSVVIASGGTVANPVLIDFSSRRSDGVWIRTQRMTIKGGLADFRVENFGAFLPKTDVKIEIAQSGTGNDGTYAALSMLRYDEDGREFQQVFPT